jgi:hypothetical protein
MAGVRFLARARDFSLFSGVQTSSEVLPITCPLGFKVSFPRVKQLGNESDHYLPFSSEIKNDVAIPPLPIHLHGVVLN